MSTSHSGAEVKAQATKRTTRAREASEAQAGRTNQSCKKRPPVHADSGTDIEAGAAAKLSVPPFSPFGMGEFRGMLSLLRHACSREVGRASEAPLPVCGIKRGVVSLAWVGCAWRGW
jgi:hypothetical protein